MKITAKINEIGTKRPVKLIAVFLKKINKMLDIPRKKVRTHIKL